MSEFCKICGTELVEGNTAENNTVDNSLKEVTENE